MKNSFGKTWQSDKKGRKRAPERNAKITVG